jgi:chemotaxis protein MotB
VPRSFKPKRHKSPVGNYLASVGDLMAGLLFVFILTTVVFAITLGKARLEAEQTKKQFNQTIQDYKQGLPDLMSVFIEVLGGEIQEDNIDKIDGVIHLDANSVSFKSCEPSPDLDGWEKLEKLSPKILNVTACFVSDFGEWGPGLGDYSCDKLYKMIEDIPGRQDRRFDPASLRIETVFLEGHSDDDSAGTCTSGFTNNWDLSTARSVRSYKLMDCFGGRGCTTSARRILEAPPGYFSELRNTEGDRVFGVAGYSDTRPRTERPNDDSELKSWKEKNRRISIRFILEPPPEITADER